MSILVFLLFVKQKTAYEMRISDWSSDVCSSDIMNLTPEVFQRAMYGEKVEHGTYRYELAIEFKEGFAVRIASEALRQKPNGQGKWQLVYERDAEGKVKDSKTFSRSEEHTSELQSLMRISYAVFCLKQKK